MTDLADRRRLIHEMKRVAADSVRRNNTGAIAPPRSRETSITRSSQCIFDCVAPERLGQATYSTLPIPVGAQHAHFYRVMACRVSVPQRCKVKCVQDKRRVVQQQ
jgi:hypothetical protein